MDRSGGNVTLDPVRSSPTVDFRPFMGDAAAF